MVWEQTGIVNEPEKMLSSLDLFLITPVNIYPTLMKSRIWLFITK